MQVGEKARQRKAAQGNARQRKDTTLLLPVFPYCIVVVSPVAD